jgi:hypothetical protein
MGWSDSGQGAPVTMAILLPVPYIAGKLLSGSTTGGFSSSAQLHSQLG